MSTGQISVGLVGFGEWVRRAYVPILKEMGDVRVVAVAAPSESTRALAREAFGDGVTLYHDYRTLLADPHINAVMMAGPNELHADIIEAAIHEEHPLFFEPPIGVGEAQVRRMLHVLNHAHQVVQPNLELRYLPVMRQMKRMIDEGAIGELLMGQVRLWADWGRAGDFKRFEKQGYFWWLGCWYLDLLDLLFEAIPKHAAVAGGYAMNGRMLDHGVATLQYEHGKSGMYEFNLCAPGESEITCSAIGTQGEIRANLQTGQYRWRGVDGIWQKGEAACSQPVYGFEGMRESIRDFFDAVRDQRKALADAEVCRRVHLAALACADAEERDLHAME
jgi:predicted dehydrogenase